MTYQRKLLNRKSKTTAVSQLKINEQVVSGIENLANDCKVFSVNLDPNWLRQYQPIKLIPYMQYVVPSSSKLTFE